jgi:hypothetical protein
MTRFEFVPIAFVAIFELVVLLHYGAGPRVHELNFDRLPRYPRHWISSIIGLGPKLCTCFARTRERIPILL